jgi:hypothetical protein
VSPSFRRSIAVRRTVALLLLPLVATNCQSWRAAEVEPRALVESEHPRDVRVTTLDSTRYVIDRPRIVADTLVGRRDNLTVAVPLRDVARVDVRRFSPGKTAAVLLVVGLFAALVARVNSASYAN